MAGLTTSNIQVLHKVRKSSNSHIESVGKGAGRKIGGNSDAASRLRDGKGIAETARLVGVHVSSVKRSKRSLESGGIEALKSKPHPGPAERLSGCQKRRLLELLSRGARQAGYRTELWTCRRVAEVIAKEFGLSYHPGHVWKILRSLALSPERPAKRAREQTVQEVSRWRREEWPRLKKGNRKAS